MRGDRRFHKTPFSQHKNHIAALGNLVPQLHLHVIGCGGDDACWPKPVWGNLPTDKPYTISELDNVRKRLQLDSGMQV